MGLKRAKQTLTPLELKIMQTLWTAGPCKVAEVQSALQADLAYTTVQTMLNILLRKGQVKRTRKVKRFATTPLSAASGQQEARLTI